MRSKVSQGINHRPLQVSRLALSMRIHGLEIALGRHLTNELVGT